MKSIIEIETNELYELAHINDIITGYLDKRNIKYKVIIGNKGIASVKVGGD